jgi:putative ABC transport system permease protein
VLGFTGAVAVATGLLFGLVPALRASRPDLNLMLRAAGPGGDDRANQRWRQMLVGGEVAVSVMLLVGAGLLLRSFAELRNVSPGFQPDNVVTMQISLPFARYPDGPASARFFEALLDRVRGMPGAIATGVTSALPLVPGGWGKYFSVEGRPLALKLEDIPNVQYRLVSADYMRAMGIPVVRGRHFENRDRANPLVAIINESLARRFFPNDDPIGKVIYMGAPESLLAKAFGPLPPGFRFPRLTVIGVAADVKQGGLDRPAQPEVFALHNHWEERDAAMFLIARTANDPMTLACAIRAEVTAADREQPVADVRSMEKVIFDSIAQPRFRTTLLGVFAGLALVLASVGLYGVMSYSAAQRTREIGVRIALGAARRDVVGMIVGQGMKVVACGVAVGLAGALALTRTLSTLLFGVSPTDWLSFSIAAAGMALVALAACYAPARRATRVDPIEALRYE